MADALTTVHGIWLYVVLIVGGLAIGQMVRGWLGGQDWQPLDGTGSTPCVVGGTPR